MPAGRSTKGPCRVDLAIASRLPLPMPAPARSCISTELTWVGGMFWDGRATGETLGDPLAEQAQGPFLNPLEQNNASAQAVIDKVQASSYSDLFKKVCTELNQRITSASGGRSLRTRDPQRSAQFTSKYDYWLKGRPS